MPRELVCIEEYHWDEAIVGQATMARRERRQRLALDLNTNLDEEPFSAQDQGNIQEQVLE